MDCNKQEVTTRKARTYIESITVSNYLLEDVVRGLTTSNHKFEVDLYPIREKEVMSGYRCDETKIKVYEVR